ncbi:MAG: Mur ligase family protein, partial [Micrococcales bacterium]|nr:Mur ligase family protein [Micrococcales bacterium]
MTPDKTSDQPPDQPQSRETELSHNNPNRETELSHNNPNQPNSRETELSHDNPDQPPDQPNSRETELSHNNPNRETEAEKAAAAYRSIMARAPENRIDPDTFRVEGSLDLLEPEQTGMRVIHIAGTNGKTSTARMVESLVRAHGLRTGLFTSPHLASPAERIQIDGQPITDAAMLEAWDLVEAVVNLVDRDSEDLGEGRLSFFEVMWLLALVAFADAPVDVAVVEVGLGGRWDATNTIDSDVQVITPISYDHADYLGHDLASIAGEKAGIIRRQAVIGRQRPEAEAVLKAAAGENQAKVCWLGQGLEVVGRELAVDGQVLHLQTPGGFYNDVYLPLHGRHQAENAALAVAAVELLLAGELGVLGEEPMAEGLGQVTSPGRLEVVSTAPTVLVDAAHNHAAAEALAGAVTEAFAFDLIGLVGVLQGKDAEAILGALEPVVKHVVITAPSSDRALDPVELAEIAVEVFGPDRVELE